MTACACVDRMYYSRVSNTKDKLNVPSNYFLFWTSDDSFHSSASPQMIHIIKYNHSYSGDRRNQVNQFGWGEAPGVTPVQRPLDQRHHRLAGCKKQGGGLQLQG